MKVNTNENKQTSFEFVNSFGSNELNSPSHIAVDEINHKLYITDTN